LETSYRKRLLVSGRVQGVGFRFFACRLAENFQITGCVRNLPDGRVEMVAEGEREQVESFLERAARGPSSSRVTEVKTYLEEPQGSFKSFGISC
jgi:acylphosphatase